ncbi:class I poly(R)-hydroxyalkanoic acid synthase [Bacterioplanes sanyensis]|uniref:Class I poly(R)-hydroxyalkanoic acid synthase n=1 Tax=Bacterioplanes sanyensis TaxID=1249553 RepID=A0A222FQ96_9GAMM|nr:class I poly(R)-hydroxyalkanoic acid synthase [Bacterioplanes sanyensis]ASP40413.1 class I poly(R)-hydroxyalkanoic acid synthase [Bacterioplanes sanyensis]
MSVVQKETVETAIKDFYDMALRATEQYTSVMDKVVNQQTSADDPAASVMTDFNEAFRELSEAMMSNPQKIMADQMELMKKQQELFQSTLLRFMGKEVEPVVVPERTDRRFKDEQWQDNPVFDFLKQLYLLQSQAVTKMVHETEGLSDHARQKVEYFTRQYVNAVSPTNFAALNPEVIRKAVETGGGSLLKGLEQLSEDMEASVKGALNVAMTDTSAFQVGRNLATTPGKVVYQNDLMQLIQYTPSTEKTFKRPLLIIPPFINKYYILDMRDKNSFVKWLVDQGHTVFMISWVNPGPALRDKDFTAYMKEGPLEAISAIEKATGEKEVNAIGYCLGGTLLAATLAYLKKKKQEPIKAATFMATLTDFSQPGEIGVFINETAISGLEKQMNALGYYDGRQMAFSFNTLRENDLFWSFFINNYLKGERPAAFDLLYWNTDSTNLPAAMHSFYLRNMYLHNRLIEKDAIELDGVKLDLRQIKVPTYYISTAQDHIALWQATYTGAKLMSGKNRFVLGGSGHIAGIVNPPEANKYGYWTNEKIPDSPDEWYQGATNHEGSWWLDWQQWVLDQGNMEQVAARQPGDAELKPIEDAPGRYVKQRIFDVLAK